MYKTESKSISKFLIKALILATFVSACAPNIDRLKEKGNIDKLVEALSYERDPFVRAEAARALGELEAEEALDPLITLLTDDEYIDVQSAAAEALGQIGGDEAVQPLINCLEDPDDSVSDACAIALADCGETAVEPLIGLLGGDKHDLTHAVMSILGRIGGPAAGPLIDVLSDTDYVTDPVGHDAYWTLVNMGSPAIPELIDRIDVDDSDFCWVIFNLLVEMGEPAVHPLIGLLSDSDDTIAHCAHNALWDMGEPAVVPLINTLIDDDRRDKAENILKLIGETAADPLIEALSDPDLKGYAGDVLISIPSLWMTSLIEAYQTNPDDAEPLLRPLVYGLTEYDLNIRQEVSNILVEIGEPAVPHILDMVRHANEVQFEDEMILASQVEYGPYWTTEGELVDGGLCDTTGDWDDKIVLCQRGNIYFVEKVENVQEGGGIGVIHYNSNEGNMNPTLASEDNDICIVSVGVSMAAGEDLLKNAIGEYIQITSLDTSSVNDTLVQIGESTIPYLIEYVKQEETRGGSSAFQMKKALIAIGPAAVPAIIEMLDDSDEDVRYDAAYLLGKIEDERCVEPLIAALEDNDSWVRWEAASSLGELQAVEAIEALIGLFDDDEDYVQEAAVDALQQIGVPAVERLLEIYRDEEAQNKDLVESALLAIFKENEDTIKNVAAKVCSGEAQKNTTEFDRYKGDVHPTVILDADSEIHEWTYDIPVNWLPFTPDTLELVVCLGESEKKSIETCEYYSTNTIVLYSLTLTRYQYKMKVALYSSFTGYQIGSTTLWGSIPDAFTQNISADDYPTYEITGTTVEMSKLIAWLYQFGFPLAE